MKFRTLQIEIEPSNETERALLVEAFDSAVDALEDRNKWPGLRLADGLLDQRNNLQRKPPRQCLLDRAQFRALEVALDVMIETNASNDLAQLRSDFARVWWEGA